MSARTEVYESVLREIEELIGRFPGDIALASVRIQLQYLIHIERGEESDRSRLGEITLGRLAVYDLSNMISDDLSKALCSVADDVRRQLRRERQKKA